MNNVRLYYLKINAELDHQPLGSVLVEQWLSALSVQKQEAIKRLLHHRSRLNSIIALRLLGMCAQDDGIKAFNLCDIHYPETGKPYWMHEDIFYDFNISHSGDYVMVVASSSMRVGLDVEKIRELKRLSFKMVLSPDELIIVHKTPALFFELWSKKEAVVKAANTVGIARMRDVKLKKDIAVLDEEKWYLKTINIDNDYAINLATSALSEKLIVEEVRLEQLR